MQKSLKYQKNFLAELCIIQWINQINLLNVSYFVTI